MMDVLLCNTDIGIILVVDAMQLNKINNRRGNTFRIAFRKRKIIFSELRVRLLLLVI